MTKRRLLLSFILLAIVATCPAQASKVADLEPGLQEALVRDAAACRKNHDAAATDADRAQLLQSAANVQTIHSAARTGRIDGVIVTLEGGCGCQGTNCPAFVYLKSDDGYRLGLQSQLSSLKLMKGFAHGMPALSGKFTVSDTQEETTIYNWDGSEYLASMCATVTQVKGRKIPTIAQHDCGKPLKKEKKK
jgi:hypothetical protein